MLTQIRAWARGVLLCLAVAGCRTAVHCSSGCTAGSSLAGVKYDCGCETTHGCAAGDDCSCGSPGDVPGCADACGAGCEPSLLDRLCGCTGCGELYWCEWHNDPPALCQPCDCRGNYIGPGAALDGGVPYRRRHVEALSPASPWAQLPLDAAIGELDDDGEASAF